MTFWQLVLAIILGGVVLSVLPFVLLALLAVGVALFEAVFEKVRQ